MINNPEELQTLSGSHWTFLRKIIFRFFFIYLFFQMIDWWFSLIPGSDAVGQYYYQLVDWAVYATNDHFFHLRKVLVYPAGSGDTSYSWVNQWLFICISILLCFIWSVIDRKRSNYQHLNYWLCVFVRYYIATVAFSYGIVKLFALQMPFPDESQLATPLGDLLPMRLSWMFLGYSTSYQVFSGCMETLVGVLLLYRRTATLGAILATAVLMNVMVLNLSYDIPVKLFSINMVIACLFLMANEYDRMLCFFVLNKPAINCSIYHFRYSKKWMNITRIVLKIAFIVLAVIVPFYSSWQRYEALVNQPESTPIKSGMYDVEVFTVNRDTILPLITDSLRWQNVVFEKDGTGSVKTADTIFTQRYKRGYFSCSADTITHTINFKKRQRDSAMYSGVILSMSYQIPDSNTVQLWGKEKNDSLYVLLKKSNRRFQLAEKQFHWLSEYNR